MADPYDIYCEMNRDFYDEREAYLPDRSEWDEDPLARDIGTPITISEERQEEIDALLAQVDLDFAAMVPVVDTGDVPF